MKDPTFSCQMCGKCCTELTISITFDDITRWIKEKKRYDILYQISFIDNYPKSGSGGFYMRETTLAPKRPCPFLEENKCTIYETRPKVCVDFPYGHEKWKKCPAWKKINFFVDKEKQGEALETQRRDFLRAHINRYTLIQQLFELRRCS